MIWRDWCQWVPGSANRAYALWNSKNNSWVIISVVSLGGHSVNKVFENPSSIHRIHTLFKVGGGRLDACLWFHCWGVEPLEYAGLSYWANPKPGRDHISIGKRDSHSESQHLGGWDRRLAQVWGEPRLRTKFHANLYYSVINTPSQEQKMTQK